MAAKDRGAREARERARLYQARQDFHAGQSRRRTRDNIVAGVAGGALILAAIGSQVVYFSSGPGAPAPAPTPTATSTPAPSETSTPEPTDSPTPSPSPTATP